MAFFKYKAVKNNNQEEIGVIEAENETQASNILENKELRVIFIKETIKKPAFSIGLLSLIKKINKKDLILFFRQFSVMVSASVTISQSLKILAEQTTNVNLKKILISVYEEVDNGEKLSDSFAKHREIFTNFYISVIKSGEKSGRLDESLIYLADEIEKEYETTSKIKTALTYPSIIFSLMIIAVFVVMIFVVPKLTEIFKEAGGELPILTRLLINVSTFFAHYWWLIILVGIGIILLFKKLLKNNQFKYKVDFILINTPILGKILKIMYIVRFTRSMHTLIIGGVTISNSLRISSDIIQNKIFQEVIEKTINEVEEGNSICTVFIKGDIIPKMASQMLLIGEKTGKLDVVLEKINNFYSKELNAILNNLMVLLEPIVMVIVGVAVGLIAGAIILPMYSITSQIQ